MSEYLDMGGINQRLAAFDKQHGASIFHEGWILFHDGAYRESNPMGLIADPPENPFDLARRKAMYHRIIFDRALRAFDQAKNNLRAFLQANLNTPMCSTPASDEAVSELNALKTMALAAKANLDAALAHVEAMKPDHDRGREQQNLRNQEMTNSLLEKINAIEV